MAEHSFTTMFKLVHNQVEIPSVHVVIGDHGWYLHRSLLCAASLKLRTNLANARVSWSRDPEPDINVQTIVLKDDPWMFARFIQYLYQSHYEGHQVEVAFRHLWCPDIHLESLMARGSSTADTGDRNRDVSEIHARMVVLADDYDAPGLLTEALQRLSLAFHAWVRKQDRAHRFWTCCDIIGSERIIRCKEIKLTLTNLILRNFSQLDGDKLQEYCSQLSAYEILQSFHKHEVR